MDDIISEILEREGGWVDRAEDRGGPTNKGITLPTLSDWLGRPATVFELKALSDEDARSIYLDRYVYKPGFNLIGSQRLLGLVVDCAVNHGITGATEMFQRALGVKDDGVLGPKTKEAIQKANYGQVYLKLCAERIRHFGQILGDDYRRLVKIGVLIPEHKCQESNAHGWLNRVAEFVEKA